MRPRRRGWRAAGFGLVLIACLVIWSGWFQSPGASDVRQPERTRAPSDLAPSRPDEQGVAIGQREPVTARADSSNEEAPRIEAVGGVLNGLVTDESGEPFPGVPVFVGASTWPFADSGTPSLRKGFQGRFLVSDEDGRFSVRVALDSEIFVAVTPSRQQPIRACADGGEVVVSSIDEEVRLCARRIPSGTVVIRARDPVTREYLDSFRVCFGDPSRPSGFMTAHAGVAKREVPVEDEDGVVVGVHLVERGGGVTASASALVLPLQEVELTLEAMPGRLASGMVQDAAGEPVPDAYVFFGEPQDGRGSKPFKSFQPRRVAYVQTDAEGQFSVSGSGSTVTVWHPEFCTARQPFGEALVFRLVKRGALEGLASGSAVRLDDEESTTIDSEGRFRFERVDPGPHGLWLDGDLFGFEMPEGGDLTLELADRSGDVTCEILSGELARLGGLCFASDRQGVRVSTVELVDGIARVSVPPDTVCHLVWSNGSVATFEVGADDLQLLMGTASITVEASEGASFYLSPAGADELTRYLCDKVTRRTIRGTSVSFPMLSPGTYTLHEVSSGASRDVELGEAGTVLSW